MDTPAPAPAPALDPVPAPSQSKNLEAQRKATNRPKHQQTKPTYTNITRGPDPNSNEDQNPVKDKNPWVKVLGPR